MGSSRQPASSRVTLRSTSEWKLALAENGVPLLFSRMDGLVGRMDIPDLGAHIGDFVSVTLTRRGDVQENPRDPEANYCDLHAVLRFVNKVLFEDPDYKTVVTVWAKKSPKRKWVLEPRGGPEQQTVLKGRSLIMERVELMELKT